MKIAYIEENNSFNERQILRAGIGDFAEEWMVSGIILSDQKQPQRLVEKEGRGKLYKESTSKRPRKFLTNFFGLFQEGGKPQENTGVEENPDKAINQPRAHFWATNLSRKSGISSLQTCL